ncbi:PQQ-like beta-propeller repeat protein [Actinomadura madurae]|nr:PQQ-like beta-propeller repeat protein [Actinomadura madurae]
MNTRNGLLVAVDTAGGRGLWRQRLHPDSHGGPVLADGLLHIGDRGLSSFDPATGRLVRRIGADHRSRPIHPENLCASGGTLYHANIHGELLATPHTLLAEPRPIAQGQGALRWTAVGHGEGREAVRRGRARGRAISGERSPPGPVVARPPRGLRRWTGRACTRRAPRRGR